eukprot:TRINITY_DN2295_c0_g1_i9.p1 TRINITY_DN2295_c0_g1~~TRINITY_DN2295_c0_g1_i9.p1  ORF type:complete len:409 (-),score=42.92 TRINITY_DN2295_c0_g1_i9:37-1263(-)
MKIIGCFFTLLLPALILCAHIEWEVVKAVGESGSRRAFSLMSPNGTAHFFWIFFKSSCFHSIRYRRISKDGTLSDTETVSGSINVDSSYDSLSADISDDGRHLLLVFYSDKSAEGEIFFTESLNGGEDWTRPVAIKYAGYEPVLFLEKDTGRVYVMFDWWPNIKLIVREPGAKKFGETMIVYKNRTSGGKYLTQVIDKKTSKRVFHLFTDVFDGRSSGKISHLKSFDGPRNWTLHHAIASDLPNSENLPVAVGAEGYFYVQYHKGPEPRRIEVVWTKNYGETWESPIAMQETFLSHHSMAMCGKGSGERVISINGKTRKVNGYMRYLKPGQTEFKDLNYPFPPFKLIEDVHVSCVYDGNGKYTFALILIDEFPCRVFVAYGTAYNLSLIHICRCRRIERCRSRWSPYH